MKRVLLHFLEKNNLELEIFLYYVKLTIKTNFFIGYFLQYNKENMFATGDNFPQKSFFVRH